VAARLIDTTLREISRGSGALELSNLAHRKWRWLMARSGRSRLHSRFTTP